MRRTAMVVGFAVAVAVLCVVVYLGAWWLIFDVRNRDAAVTRRGYEVQQTYRDQVLKTAAEIADLDSAMAAGVSDEQRAAFLAQRRALVDRGCAQAGRLVGNLPPSVDEFVTVECGKV